ncbi:MAG: NHLP family bacteriocin export ABC transporter peptidase/permease/ATPase subunit [Lachnospiraceae bacterium]|nr:NHLP family bacteriocin export ABC transporter peptidase/permease/ATPase subunit [Lachnospiraceae bacterium]
MANRIKKPVSKKVAKVPIIMQMEALECGAACLAMILAYYGKWIPLEKIRADCGVSRDGSNAGNIMNAAGYYGLKKRARRYEPDVLRQQGTFPCIIHWDFDHFVVLDGFRNNRAYINDPARGIYNIDMDTLDESFTGICMEFEPGDDFRPEGKPKSIIRFVLKRVQGHTSMLLLAALIAVIISLTGIIRPGFGKVFLDNIITGEKPEWIIPFFVLLFVLTVIEILITGIREVYNLKISGKLDTVDSALYMWKVLSMPVEFFSQRMAGDLQERQRSNALVADVLINTAAPLLMDSVLLILYLSVMLDYSWMLTVVGLSALVINIIISGVVSRKRVNVSRVAMRDTAKLTASTLSGIELIETIKLNGAENGFFGKWAGYLANENTDKIKFQKINQTWGALPQFIIDFSNAAVLVLGAYLVIKGQFTAGMILAFQGLMTAFMNPALTFITAGQTIQEMVTHMERIDDVMEYPVDTVFSESEEGEANKLSGHLEVRNLTFGYSKLGKNIISDISFSVEPGKSIAIVGDSGCGKSTVAKLLVGLYKPWEGEILYDGRPLSGLNKDIFNGSVAMVDQDVILFEDTIANNIKMWDDSIEDFEMILAAKDAQIYSDIMERPEGFRTRVLESGKNFSGGQRQRIEIARVLAQDPTIIILDEATSAIDAKTEYELVRAIRDRGITCVVIAHRLSTIRSCDEIIVLDKGQVAGRGKHDELMKNCNLYRNLVTSI